jgi:hypothetical protein
MRAGGREGHLSSVDNADTPSGQIVVVQALFDRMHGKSGSYGVASTANAGAPSPAPTASPTSTSVAANANTNAKPGRQVKATP